MKDVVDRVKSLFKKEKTKRAKGARKGTEREREKEGTDMSANAKESLTSPQEKRSVSPWIWRTGVFAGDSLSFSFSLLPPLLLLFSFSLLFQSLRVF